MKQIKHEARPGGPTMAAVSVTRLTQHAPVFRLELLFFSCSPTPPGTSLVGGKRTQAACSHEVRSAPMSAFRSSSAAVQSIRPVLAALSQHGPISVLPLLGFSTSSQIYL